jgi:hypothetical protein
MPVQLGLDEAELLKRGFHIASSVEGARRALMMQPCIRFSSSSGSSTVLIGVVMRTHSVGRRSRIVIDCAARDKTRVPWTNTALAREWRL